MERAGAAFQDGVDLFGRNGFALGFRPCGNAFAQGGGVEVFLIIGVAEGGQPEVARAVFVEGGHLVNHVGGRAGGHGFGKLQCVGRLHAHAAVAAHAGHAGGGVGAVDAEAEFGVAQAHEYGAERVFRAGRHAGDAVFQFFLDGFGDVPGGVEGFRADFVRADVGLRHRFADGDGIDFAEFAVGIEEQALLRDVDDDVGALGNGGNIGDGGGGEGGGGRKCE